MSKKLAVIILSCDKYSDLWDLFFNCFFLNWPDCPFKIYLIANEKKFYHNNVTTLYSGEDHDWSSSLMRCLEKIPEENLLFLFEDFLMWEKISTQKVLMCYEFFVQSNLNYLRLRPTPKPSVKVSNVFGLISNNDIYRTSLPNSIWKKETFFALMVTGESAWDFELKGTERSRHFNGFASTYNHVFKIIHCVERGKWINSAYEKVIKSGFIIDSKRPLLFKNKKQELFRDIANYLKFKIIDMLPSNIRKKSMMFSGKLKNINHS